MNLTFSGKDRLLIRKQLSNTQYKKKSYIVNYTTNVKELQKYYAKWKKLGTERHLLNDSTYMNCPEEANP